MKQLGGVLLPLYFAICLSKDARVTYSCRKNVIGSAAVALERRSLSWSTQGFDKLYNTDLSCPKFS